MIHPIKYSQNGDGYRLVELSRLSPELLIMELEGSNPFLARIFPALNMIPDATDTDTMTISPIQL